MQGGVSPFAEPTEDRSKPRLGAIARRHPKPRKRKIKRTRKIVIWQEPKWRGSESPPYTFAGSARTVGCSTQRPSTLIERG